MKSTVREVGGAEVGGPEEEGSGAGVIDDAVGEDVQAPTATVSENNQRNIVQG
jgi:hypothetical protein